MKNNLLGQLVMLSKYVFYGIVIQCFLTSMLIASDIEAQEVKTVYEVYLDIDINNASLSSVFSDIESLTDFKFSYYDNIDPDTKVSIASGEQSLSDILLEISRKTGLSFRQVNNTINVKEGKINKRKKEEKIEVIIDGITVTGKVTDENNLGLPGVNVVVKGTTQGTVTNLNGEYSIDVPSEESVLVYSSVGYVSEEISVGSQTSINISLTPDVTALEEIVVVGYGEQSKETLSGSVVAVKGQELMKSPTMSVSNSLAGRLPGVVVIQESGEPGEDAASINIRGRGTLGDSEPLVVIDGIPDRLGGISRLDPQDIESISVLKDASAAIYGARAANGAIIVTTKRGEKKKPTLSYNFNYGMTRPTRVPEMSNAVEYANIMNELPIYQSIPVNEWDDAWQSIKTNGVYDSPTDGVETLSANYSPEAIELHRNGSDPWGYPDTDWFGDTFKSWAPQTRHHLDFDGGTENISIYSSLGYSYQDAIYDNSATYYEQYNFRTNLDVKANEYINAKLDVAYRQERRNFPTQGAGSIFRMLMRGRPTEPAVWPNGKPGPDIENGQNPVVITTNATGNDKNVIDLLQTTGVIDITNPWIDGLKLTLMGSADKASIERKLWQTPWQLYYWDRTSYEPDGETPLLEPAVRSNFTDPRLTQESGKLVNSNLTALLNYDLTFGVDNHLNVLAGVTREEFSGSNFFAFRRNFISPAIDQLFAGGTEAQNTGGEGFERARLGYYGRVQYDFQAKYLLEFIWRYDGSYIFPESNRFGFFPGIMAGWNLSNESFFNFDFVNFLKLRASYGEMGNDRVVFPDDNGNLILQEYAFLSTYGFGQYPINNQVVTTLGETVLANPNFTWERANNLNVGLDGTLFNGKIDFVFEYFYNKRDQILIQETGSTPASSGINTLLPPVNAGQVDNSGFDFNLRYNGGDDDSDLKWDVSFGGGFAKNEVVYMDEVPGIPEYQKQEGKPIDSYLVYKSDGAFLNQQEIDNNTIDYSDVTSQLIPGDMKIKDVNNDGKIDGDDQVRIEESDYPTFNFGSSWNLEYKNFDLSILWQGATGASIRILTESGDIGNFLKYDHDNRWSIENPSSEYPRLASRGDTYYTGGNYGNNTYLLHSKDYIRVKNIELGYTIPENIIKPLSLSYVRLYVNGLNLITIDKNNIFDPEATNQAGTYYPLQKVFNAGFRLSF